MSINIELIMAIANDVSEARRINEQIKELDKLKGAVWWGPNPDKGHHSNILVSGVIDIQYLKDALWLRMKDIEDKFKAQEVAGYEYST